MDRVIFREIGSELQLACTGNGNYDSVQSVNGRALCVDADGFPVSDFTNSTKELQCNRYQYALVTEPDD